MRKSPVLALIFIACGGGASDVTSPPSPPSPPPPPPPVATTVTIAGSSSMSAGATVQFTASVLDQRGSVMSGQAISYSTTTPSLGSVSSAGLFLSAGLVGTASVVATSGALSATANVAIGAAAATQLSKVLGDAQTGTVATALSDSLSVKVSDSFGNAVSGIPVAWSAPSGTLSASNSTTGVDGITRVKLTLGNTAGLVSVTATVNTSVVTSFTETAKAGSAAQLSKILGDAQVGTVATMLTDSLSVKASDSFGNPVSGIPVAWSAPSGTLSASSSTTGADGITRVRLTLGNTAGSVSVTATVNASVLASFTETAKAGPAASLVAASGTNQTGFVSSALRAPLAVVAKDAFQNAVQGTMVSFSVTGGNGQVGSTNALTDALGVAQTSWTLGPSVGSNSAKATLGSLAQSFTATGDSPYQVQIVFAADVPVSIQSVFNAAIDRWRHVITTDIGASTSGASGGSCAGHTIAPNITISGLLVYVDMADLGANLYAQAGYCYTNALSGFPVVAAMTVNTRLLSLMFANGVAQNVMTHELGHAMGFGSLWSMKNVIVGSGSSDPYFTGSRAVSAFRSGFGSTYSGNPVPVENTGGPGTANGHWRKTVFNAELMTGFATPGIEPLSAVTIAQFGDLGYTVDMSSADSFAGLRANVLSDTGRGSFPLGDDVLRFQQGTFQPAPRRR